MVFVFISNDAMVKISSIIYSNKKNMIYKDVFIFLSKLNKRLESKMYIRVHVSDEIMVNLDVYNRHFSEII